MVRPGAQSFHGRANVRGLRQLAKPRVPTRRSRLRRRCRGQTGAHTNRDPQARTSMHRELLCPPILLRASLGQRSSRSARLSGTGGRKMGYTTRPLATFAPAMAAPARASRWDVGPGGSTIPLSELNIDLQRQVVTSRGPLLPVEDFNADHDPADRHEAEVDMPRLGRLALMTVCGLRLLPMLEMVKCVIGADEAEVCECVQDSRVPFVGRSRSGKIGPAVQIAHHDRGTGTQNPVIRMQRPHHIVNVAFTVTPTTQRGE